MLLITRSKFQKSVSFGVGMCAVWLLFNSVIFKFVNAKWPPRWPCHTWLRAIESDPRPLHIGPSYAWKKAASRAHWRSIVDTATLKKNMPWRQKHANTVYGVEKPSRIAASSAVACSNWICLISQNATGWFRTVSVVSCGEFACSLIMIIVFMFELRKTQLWDSRSAQLCRRWYPVRARSNVWRQ